MHMVTQVYFFNSYIANMAATQKGEKEVDSQMNNYANPLDARSPMVSEEEGVPMAACSIRLLQ
jgi:hypothetical protein